MTSQSVEAALARAKALADLNAWPGSSTIDPLGWLSNFDSAEQSVACHLLNAFMFYPEPMTEALFRASVQAVSPLLVAGQSTRQGAATAWQSFLARVIVTYVEGEVPNVTDSGLVFARKARQLLGISQERILDPDDAISRWWADRSRPLLFVDDFVGSGSQMETTWHRPRDLSGGASATFSEAARLGLRAYYTPLFATNTGRDAISRDCRGLTFLPCHVLDNRFKLTSDECLLYPAGVAGDVRSLVASASDRAGIVKTSTIPWDGYGNLGLGLAFSHGVPDATLPLFYWDANGWTPLVVRG